MDVITIESAAFNQIIGRMTNLENRIAEILKEAQYPLNERWLDNQQVCELLMISKRLLQMYRDEKKIPYSQINHKIYYKASDIQIFLKKNYKPLSGY